MCSHLCLRIQEHKLMRNQSIGGSKLPDLSETVEQEKGDSPCLLSCPCKTKSSFCTVVMGVHFLNLRENLFQSQNDDLYLSFFLCATHLLATSQQR